VPVVIYSPINSRKDNKKKEKSTKFQRFFSQMQIFADIFESWRHGG
jgi:hypothetical protein